MKKVLIIGAGAIGCLYGSKLAEAGLEVSLVSQSLAASCTPQKTAQIRIDSPWGNSQFRPKHVYNTVANVTEHAEILIISAKTLETDQLIQDIAATITNQTQAIVLLQNGIHIEKAWQAAFPTITLISGLAFVCCFRLSPQHICHQDYGRLMIGDYPSGISKATQLLTQSWQQTGVPVIASENVPYARWKKLLWNAAFNPLSVIKQQNTQELLATAEGEALSRLIMAEVQQLASADGHALTDEDIQRNITDTRNMAPYKTSMLLDYENNRPLEVEAILGNALRFAIEKGISVPQIEALYTQLKKL
jgi:2-dehydropantoate 2-reductase